MVERARSFMWPGSCGEVVEIEGLGVATGANVLGEGFVESGVGREAGRLMAWSGWAGDQKGLGDGVWSADFATWGPEGRGAFEGLCDRWAGGLKGCGGSLCFRPHGRHVLADPQTCLSFLRGRGAGQDGGVFEVLLEPAAFLTFEMLEAAEDHVGRAIEALGDRDDVPGVVVSDVRVVECEGARELVLCEPGAGVLGGEVLERMASATGKPVFALSC